MNVWYFLVRVGMRGNLFAHLSGSELHKVGLETAKLAHVATTWMNYWYLHCFSLYKLSA